MSSRSPRMNGYRTDRMEQRPPSEQMVDLHVYLVPPEIWREKYNNALNQNINDTISVGLIRVHPETRVYVLRDEIEQQLGADVIPREYVFLKSVGRSLTRLKSKQEYQLKAKSFLPPLAYCPELYLLEATPEVRAALAASSSEGSTRAQSRTSYQDYESYRGGGSIGPKYTDRSHRNDRLDHHRNDRLDHRHWNSQDQGLQRPAKHSTLPYSGGGGTDPQSLPSTNRFSPLPAIQTQHSQSHQSKSHQSPPIRIQSPQPVQNGFSQKDKLPQSPHKLSVHENSSTINGNNGRTESYQYPSLEPSSWDDPPAPTSDIQPTNSDKPNLNNTSRSDSTPHNKYPDTPVDQPPVPPITSPRRPPQEKQPPLPQHQEEYLPPLSATPPHSESPKQNKHTADSGIAGLTPEETHRENNVLDRRKPVEDRLEPPDKLEEEAPAEQWAGPPERQEARQVERPDNYRREEERPPPQQEPELQKNASDEELKRFPSPPPLRLASPDTKRDSDSARQRRQKEKEQLLKELERAREARRVVEKQREELVRRAKQMQNKTQNRRNHARDLWKKRYFEEKKKTIPLEEQCNRLRHELEIIHKKLMTTLEGPKEKATKLQEFRPSPKNNHKIQATRLQHEIDDIRRRVENAKMRLTGEMKLRNQAETELRALRAELTQKKINLTLSRHSQLTAYAPPVADVNMFTPRPAGLTPRS